LEILAWSPRFLGRVVLILARLAHIEIKGNWGNTPFNSLVDIFRPWFPQTGASLEERIRVLDMLKEKEPEIAFGLLDRLAYSGPDAASLTARPKWRNYDTGAVREVPQQERFRMVHAAADRMILLAKGDPGRVARLIEKSNEFDEGRRNDILALAEEFISSGTDEAREVVRAGLRKVIHWHRNYDKSPESAFAEKLKPLEELYERLASQEPIIRYRWLFAESYPKLPTRVRDDYTAMIQRLESERVHALQEIYKQIGMDGIERLVAICPGKPWVGSTLAKLDLSTEMLAEWIFNKASDLTDRDPLKATIHGLLQSLPQDQAIELIRCVLQEAENQHWLPEKRARFLTLARPERVIWSIAASCGSEVEKAYWSQVQEFWSHGGGEDFEFAVRRLLEVKRPRTAFWVYHLVVDRTDPHLIADILAHILQGEEMDGPLPDQWVIEQAIEHLEASGVIDNQRLVQLEFLALPLLGYGNEHRAKTLYATLLSDPALFCELICILYKAKHGGHEEPMNEMRKRAEEIAWRVLYNCRTLPGAHPDGTVDEKRFFYFIEKTRELCRRKDRIEVCDITLGQILAYSPVGQDGIWPFEPARKILDHPDVEDMREGFIIGTLDKRGATMRAFDEGGAKERELAAQYRAYANALRTSCPILASALDRIADSFEHQAKHEDLGAQQRLEGLW
jgi:hypothetical protein